METFKGKIEFTETKLIKLNLYEYFNECRDSNAEFYLPNKIQQFNHPEIVNKSVITINLLKFDFNSTNFANVIANVNKRG